MELFRTLDASEQADFRKWAHDNYAPGMKIETGLWHPVILEELAKLETLTARMRKAAKDAIEVQNACNLSGVIRSFADILSNTLWPYASEFNHGTQWVNQHCISRAFSDKIASLSGTQNDSNAVYAAFDECEKLARS